MANTIKIRRSAVQGATPTTAQLALGELALNTYDGKLFLKKDNGSESIVEIGAGGGGDVTLAGANAFTGANTFANTTTLLNQQPLRFSETTGNGTNYVALRAPASVDADITWTLPGVDGTTGQVLSTNGTGTLSWATASGGGGGTPGGSDTQLQFNDGGAFGGDADLTWNKTTNVLTAAGDISLNDGGTFTTTLQTVTATANRVISIPDATGTAALVAGSSGNLIVNQSGAQAGVANSSVDNATGAVTLGSRFISTYATTASAPAVSITGAWRAGNNADSLANLYVSPGPASAGTAWSTAGTGIGVNAAAAFAGDLLHLMINGTSEWKWSNTTFTLGDANDIAVGTGTGTKIGTATTQKIGFFNKAPVVQPTAVADATDAATVITQLNALLSRMRDLGLIAT